MYRFNEDLITQLEENLIDTQRELSLVDVKSEEGVKLLQRSTELSKQLIAMREAEEKSRLQDEEIELKKEDIKLKKHGKIGDWLIAGGTAVGGAILTCALIQKDYEFERDDSHSNGVIRFLTGAFRLFKH